MGKKEMHDNKRKAPLMLQIMQRMPLFKKFADAFERGMTINESMARDNAIFVNRSKNDKAFTSIG
jgi:hypothetical protein